MKEKAGEDTVLVTAAKAIGKVAGKIVSAARVTGKSRSGKGKLPKKNKSRLPRRQKKALKKAQKKAA